ncbi:MAG: ABC transporter substrate-binding protein [Anaerolineales bacterium]|nr:ABC transporter substrate-binding protein [Anaerolineales bacterium]
MKLNKSIAIWNLLVVAALLAACGSPATETEQPIDGTVPIESEPVVLRIGWAGSPDSLNPGVGVLTEAYVLYELMYDAMYQLNLDGTFSLELAENVQNSEDGTVWTYTLREGVKFHDGQPLTAEDVAFSYNFYAAHEDFPFLPIYTEYIASVEASDEKTVVVTLSEAIPNIESQLMFLYVLPKHIWEQYDNEGAAEFENLEMIGSGPFRVLEYRQNEFIHLAAVKDHFLYPPKVDEVVFQTFENPDALVQAIKTGQVDMITEMPATAVASLHNEANVAVVSGSPLAPSLSDIIFNQVTPENCPPEDGVCSGHPALLDRNVRLALAHATDKKKLIDVLLLGMGEPGLTLVPSGLGHWYNNTIQDYEYDVAKANQILDDAGYLDADGDGVRELPDGSQSLAFRMNWPSDSVTGPRMAELLSEMWAEVKVKLELQALDPDALTAICCPGFDYDIILWGWGSDPDPSFLLSVYLTDEIPTGTNESGYGNPEFDELYSQQTVTLDTQERQDIIWQMQRIVHEDIVYIIPYYDLTVQAYRTDRFSGWITDTPKLALDDITSLIAVEPVK